ncbi:unnamed protein product [Euphydryas editha]|uniref:Uncharacterized protein n=1 Tax=Euphydryas editha TaxID=104508 RepID=A0AAU9UAJ7_EUPED|nr:unnamed protein product [Euphydryas editha]
MGITELSQNMNAFILAAITVVLCVILHFIYNTIFGNKKSEVQNHEAENVTEASTESTSKPTVAETRAGGKSKKRAPWKGKTDFNHPWLLKNLKGHPGTVLLMDFSANGKFMAATCDGKLLHF